MRKLMVLLLVNAMTSMIFAWHEGKPSGEKFRPEVTESELHQQQRFQRTIGETGPVVRDDNDLNMSPAMNDSNAAKTLSNVTPPEQSASNLIEADKRIKEHEKRGSGYALWSVLIGCAAFGSVFLVRQWANKNVPAPLDPKRVNW